MNSIKSIIAVIVAVSLTGLAACTSKQADDMPAAGTEISAAQSAAGQTATGRAPTESRQEEGTTATGFSPDSESGVPSGLVLFASPTVVSDGKLTLNVSYSGSGEISFGEDYSIEREDNGKWSVVEPKEEMAFIAIAYLLSPDSRTHKQAIDLSYGYGSLPKGNYRIVKSFFGANTSGASVIMYAPFAVA